MARSIELWTLARYGGRAREYRDREIDSIDKGSVITDPLSKERGTVLARVHRPINNEAAFIVSVVPFDEEQAHGDSHE